MNALQSLAFAQLLTSWNRREDARSAGLRQLADARWELDRARSVMRASLTDVR